MTQPGSPRRITIGVDTHKYVHVAVALDTNGGRIGQLSVTADQAGYRSMEEWATGLGEVAAFGVEGTGSYGAGLTSLLRRKGHKVIEVLRPDRRQRRLHGKNDALDAENAAQAVLSGQATAIPKTQDGAVEMLRQIKVAKDTAVKARTTAMITLKQIIVNTPPELREQLAGLSKMALIDRCANLRPGAVTSPMAAAKHTLRSLARRWLDLDTEIKTHEQLMQAIITDLAPQLVAAFGIGADTAAEMLLVVGDDPQRIHSEAAFAKLCGVSPIPASSGMTNRHRINRGGNRQANAALYRSVIVRMQHHEPTKTYVARRTTEGRSKRDIIRCLKRFLAREIWALMRPLREAATTS